MNSSITFEGREDISYFDDLDPISEAIFARLLSEWPGDQEVEATIPVDLIDQPGRLLLYVDLPGLQLDCVEFHLRGHILEIQGEFPTHREAQSGRIYFKERAAGKFQRSLALPGEVDCDRMLAELRDGVLLISIPKK